MTHLQTRAAELVTLAIEELSQLDQWVVWKPIHGSKVPLKRDDSGDKPRLVGASHSEPADWTSHASALAALELGARGTGFVFSDYDPYSGIDLDGCRDKDTGIIAEWAWRWIRALDSYTEISPSGTGVKIWVRGNLPDELKHSFGPHIGIEVYSKHRYFAYTGKHLAGTPTEIRDAQYALDLMWAEYHVEPPPSAPRKEYKVSKGEAANDRQNARDVIERLNRSNDAGDYLEHKGATLIRTRGNSRYYTGLAGDSHANGQTYIVSPAKDGIGHICFSYSPNGKLNKTDFPRGFRWFDAVCALEHSGDVTAALKALNPIQPRQQPATVYRTAQQDADAERRRAERRADATATRDKVAEQAKADDRLTPCDRATLQAMLDWAAEHHSASCWAGRTTIAQRAGYSLGSVKRSIMLLEDYGYFTSEGSGGAFYQTAKRTFTRGSLFADETIKNPKDDPRKESIACEGGAAPALEEIEPAHQAAVNDEFTPAVAGAQAKSNAECADLDMAEIERMVAEIQIAANIACLAEHHEPESYWERHEARTWQEAHPIAPEPPAAAEKRQQQAERNKERLREKWDAMTPGQLGRELGVLRNYLKSHPAVRWPRWQISELNERLAALTPVSEAVDTPPSQAPARRPAQPTPATLQPDLFADAPAQSPYYVATLALAERLKQARI